jgi:diacylglycerol kinase
MKKFFKSFVYAFNGIVYALKTQLSFQIECAVTLVVVLLGCYLDLNQNEWLWIAMAITLVLVLELLNTAIEVLVDLVSPQQNPKAGAIKDIASGAVLVGALFSIIVGLFIFIPKFCLYVA